MEPNREIESILSSVWEHLARAANNPSDAFRRLWFATVRGQAPRARSVILRRVEREERRLSFHTDRRSEKVSELRSNGRVALQGWDPDRRVQIRLRGRATLHVDDAVCTDLWASEAPRSLVQYCRETAPGEPIETPAQGEGKATDDSLTGDDVAGGRPNFAVVRTVIESIDWLRLRRDGDRRAQFQFNRPRQVFDGTWVAP